MRLGSHAVPQQCCMLCIDRDRRKLERNTSAALVTKRDMISVLPQEAWSGCTHRFGGNRLHCKYRSSGTVILCTGQRICVGQRAFVIVVQLDMSPSAALQLMFDMSTIHTEAHTFWLYSMSWRQRSENISSRSTQTTSKVHAGTAS